MIGFAEAVPGLFRGDFSALEPLFQPDAAGSRIIEWFRAGRFDREPNALAEALTCACFLGRTDVASVLLAHGVDPAAGAGTGLDAFHWAANRGQLAAVELLIRHRAALEARSGHGGTVLGTAVWSAINEPRPAHLAIIETLLAAGARFDGAGYPTGNGPVDEVLRRRRPPDLSQT